jgi:hypothetical protein
VSLPSQGFTMMDTMRRGFREGQGRPLTGGIRGQKVDGSIPTEPEACRSAVEGSVLSGKRKGEGPATPGSGHIAASSPSAPPTTIAGLVTPRRPPPAQSFSSASSHREQEALHYWDSGSALR